MSSEQPIITGAQKQAMEAIFSLHDAVSVGKLSIADIEVVVRLAVADGHEMILICLAMAARAVELAKRR